MDIQDGKLAKDFTKKFKDKEAFDSFFQSLYKQGIPQGGATEWLCILNCL